MSIVNKNNIVHIPIHKLTLSNIQRLRQTLEHYESTNIFLPAEFFKNMLTYLDQFGSQEKGSEQDIKEFCTKNYAVTFPIFSKVEINGDQAEPLFKFLKREIKGFLGTESVKWNFSKFLVNRNGQVVKRYGSLDFPENLESEIKALLGT